MRRHMSSFGTRRPESAPSDDAGGKGQLIQVATRCSTIDEFVEKFAAFAWEGSLVLPAASALPVGTQGRFVILLRDHSVAMRGRCRVTEAKPQPASPRNPDLKKIMLRVALLEMDEASRNIHKRLVALRSAPVPLPVAPEPSETTQIEPARQGSAPHAAAPPPAAPPPVAAAPAPAPAPVAPSQAPAPVPVAAVRPTPPLAGMTAPPPGVTAPPIKAPPPAPPVSLNRTMIGIGIRPDGKAVLAQPVSPPSPTAPKVPTPLRVETRVPGAPDQLPANPLSEFSAGDVDSFIEYKLLEAQANMPPASEEAAPDGPTTADGPLPQGDDTAAVRLARLTKNLPPGLQRVIAKVPPPTQRRIVRAAPYAAIAVVGIVAGFALRGKPAAPPPPARAAAPVAAVKPPVPEPAPPPEAKTEEPPAPPAAAARVEPPPAKKIAAAEKPAVEKPAAEKAPAEKPAAEKPQKLALAEKEPAPQKAAAIAAKPAPAEKPAPREEAPPVANAGPRNCTARIVTQPKDVKVIWGGQLIGNTPLDSARVPCGPATVSLERERWQVVTVEVNAEAGAAASVEERLRRPRGTIEVTSSPPGAQISVNRVGQGAAPKQIDVQRYEKIQIKATLKGYQPWTKTVYLKDPESKIDIQLVARK